MILVDTGAFYALADRNDKNHRAAVSCLRSLRGPLVTHTLILAESWYLLESRLGREPARRLCERVAAGDVALLPVEAEEIASALTIESRYEDLAIGLTDAVSVALCERERIDVVFTFDRKDFASFRPSHVAAFKLVP